MVLAKTAPFSRISCLSQFRGVEKTAQPLGSPWKHFPESHAPPGYKPLKNYISVCQTARIRATEERWAPGVRHPVMLLVPLGINKRSP